MELQGKRVLVVGMGKSGLAALELLREKGAVPIAMDSRSVSGLEGVEVRAQNPQGFEGVDLVVMSPGVPLDVVPASNTAPVIGEVELASYFLRGRSIGITGSNGKTTTTALLGHILKHCGIDRQVGGNIGTPPTAMIAASSDERINVLELSSFQLETISNFSAWIGVCLNLTPDHLDRHKTMEAYAAAKGRLFATQTESGYAVLNADDRYCIGYAAQTKARKAWFSLTKPVDEGLWLDGSEILHRGGTLMKTGEIPLRGLHNVENVMAAGAAAMLAGAEPAQVREAVMKFKGVEHRLEFVRRVDGVAYYNDSKATNVDAALKALDAFETGLWVILGGKDKDGDYAPLIEPLRRKSRAALTVGAASAKIANVIQSHCRTEMCGTIQDALALAHSQALPGDTVLLAPACASFDQFDNYEHRGRVFKALVHELKEGRKA